MRRPNARADYKSFPSPYMTAAYQYRDNGTARMGPFTYWEAYNIRRDLYRYAGFCRNHNTDLPLDHPDHDDVAAELAHIFNEVQLAIDPPFSRRISVPTACIYYIVFNLHPAIRAERQSQQGIEHILQSIPTFQPKEC